MDKARQTVWRSVTLILFFVAQFATSSLCAAAASDRQEVTGGKEYCTVWADRISLREKPGNHTKIVHWLGKTARIEYLGRTHQWAKVLFKGDTCYTELCRLDVSDKVQAELPAWINLDEMKGTWGGIGYYFSTDRVMEALPDFCLLQGRVPLDPDLCFDIAFWLLLVAGILIVFFDEGVSFGNVWYWFFYVSGMVIALCELYYVFASPDPLGFCDVNNVWWPKAWFYIFLVAAGLNQQVRIFATVLFATQADKEFDFKAGLSMKILLLGAMFFVVSVVAYHFDVIFPMKVNIVALIILCLPILLMLYRLLRGGSPLAFLLMVPFYAIMATATLALYCLVGIAMAVLMFIQLVLMLMGDEMVYMRKGSQWYYTDYDSFMENHKFFRDNYSDFRFGGSSTKY